MNDTGTKQTKRAKNTQYIIFQLGETRFGVKINQVLRIIRLSPVTRVPNAPSFLEGVINYHSQVIPVVDLKKRLALPAEDKHNDASRILIVDLETQSFGMLVDSVAEIIRLPDTAIEQPPEMVAQVNGVYLKGIAHHQSHLIVLLNLERVLTVKEVEETHNWQAEQTTSENNT